MGQFAALAKRKLHNEKRWAHIIADAVALALLRAFGGGRTEPPEEQTPDQMERIARIITKANGGEVQ